MLSKEFLEKEYIQNNKSSRKISEELNISEFQVTYWLKKYNLPIKPRGGRYNTKNLIGQEFGELKVIEQGAAGKDCAIWICKCNCGNMVNVKSTYLRRGEIKSCGKCQECYNWKGIEFLSGTYYGVLRNGAKKRNLTFDISIEYLWELFIIQNAKCALTGREIILSRSYSDRKQTASVDRIDPSKGYIEGNVQWVHKAVNFAKQSMNQQEFINMCIEVAQKHGDYHE